MLLLLTLISALLYSMLVEYCNHRFVLHRSYEVEHIKEHHRVHHYIYSSNYGIGSTIWDVIFRTKKTADIEREARMLKKG